VADDPQVRADSLVLLNAGLDAGDPYHGSGSLDSWRGSVEVGEDFITLFPYTGGRSLRVTKDRVLVDYRSRPTSHHIGSYLQFIKEAVFVSRPVGDDQETHGELELTAENIWGAIPDVSFVREIRNGVWVVTLDDGEGTERLVVRQGERASIFARTSQGWENWGTISLLDDGVGFGVRAMQSGARW
jgi:hypothetical protein